MDTNVRSRNAVAKRERGVAVWIALQGEAKVFDVLAARARARRVVRSTTFTCECSAWPSRLELGGGGGRDAG